MLITKLDWGDYFRQNPTALQTRLHLDWRQIDEITTNPTTAGHIPGNVVDDEQEATEARGRELEGACR